MASLNAHFLLWFILISILILAFHKRESIRYKFNEIKTKISHRLGNRIHLNDNFVQDLEAGLSSKNFDIVSQNRLDSRKGLDEGSKEEIKKLMHDRNITFDDARLLLMSQKFGNNNIAPDGTPMDPKAVTFRRD
ncbi:LAFE_0F09890g1_1 [Lachancea fermentati]|uniref:LAFE_0F09890g1_1 n=1 Tax=Lachancea fermentati TaxID=4955 RepID=A0A1G4MFA7_LACFM|nr:LAFE_0F09890g1_1 [Lachancea fermentati]